MGGSCRVRWGGSCRVGWGVLFRGGVCHAGVEWSHI